MDDPKVVILCGGLGTRLKEQTEYMPKPLVQIGGRPILWHIMKMYAHYGFKDFIFCLGYKGEMIKNYFLNYPILGANFTLDLKTGERVVHTSSSSEDWRITFVETGLETQTGGRLRGVAQYITGDYLLLTYGDGVADVDVPDTIRFHKDRGVIATLTGVHQPSKYGQFKVNERGLATAFRQKPRLDDLVNGGFMVLNREFIDEIRQDSDPIEAPFNDLAQRGQLAVYNHNGVWYCMDTQRDVEDLNSLCESGNPPWKVWK